MNHLMIPSTISWHSSATFVRDLENIVSGQRILLLANESQIQRLSIRDSLKRMISLPNVQWIGHIPQNPTPADIVETLRLCNAEKPAGVVAIGGGSTIDLAKACVALWYLKEANNINYNAVLHSIVAKEYVHHSRNISVLAVPTTAGTGSEVTKWATVWDFDEKRKYSVEASWLCPSQAAIVPEFTSSMPVRLTLSTGLDALSHALEAYWAKSSNEMVRELSKAAIRLIIKYLPKAAKDGKKLQYRRKMCLGSLFAGLAFSHTRTTACHSLSYPLTTDFGVEHGFACAVSLAQMLQKNFPVMNDVDELMDALSIREPAQLQEWLDAVVGDEVTLRLSYFGVKETDLERLAEMAFTPGRIDNNPVDLTSADILQLLQNLY